MALIPTIEIFRKYVKLSATSTSTVVLPDFDMPEWKYLVPILTNDLYDLLVTNTATPGYAKLLDLSRAVIAPMAQYHNLAFIQGTATDTGIKVMSSDTMQSAPKWVYREMREGLLEKASFATERLIEYLIKSGNTDPLVWNNELIKNSLFKTGKDFSAVSPLHQPHRTFIQLIPVINEIEDHLVNTTIGGDFYKAFKIAALTTEPMKNLSDLLRKAVANLSISKAIESLSVKVTAFGFTVKMADDTDDPYRPETQAPDRQLEMKRASALDTGTRYLMQAKAYLDANASADVFTDYFNSTFYTAPVVVDPDADPLANDDNASRTGVFAL